jgi:hypothetical protein
VVTLSPAIVPIPAVSAALALNLESWGSVDRHLASNAPRICHATLILGAQTCLHLSCINVNRRSGPHPSSLCSQMLSAAIKAHRCFQSWSDSRAQDLHTRMKTRLQYSAGKLSTELFPRFPQDPTQYFCLPMFHKICRGGPTGAVEQAKFDTNSQRNNPLY